MRWLLHRHPIAVCVVLFATVMLALKLWVLPQFFQSFGYAGMAALLLLAFAWAYWWDRRDKQRATDPD